MRIVHTIEAMRLERVQWTGQVGLVPTMGFLHEGHLSLFKRARGENQVLVASIFVNPTQFGPHEDFSLYPRNIERDLHMLEALGVDVVFLPAAAQMYPQGFSTYVDPQGPLAEQGEGALRPGHFRGVATVVLKLFQLVRPDHAYFGQKDAQQVAVITRMVSDFNLTTILHILPTIREADGVAMSSRNSYLNPEERATAAVLYQALLAGREAFDRHLDADPALVLQAMRSVVTTVPTVHLDYVEARDPVTFLPLEKLQAPALLLIAVHVGSTRLIDNFALRPDGTWDVGLVLSGSEALY
ncbi:MAG: pantoate--beta-alanine ligase [Ktedonobacteraceae bacterium]